MSTVPRHASTPRLALAALAAAATLLGACADPGGDANTFDTHDATSADTADDTADDTIGAGTCGLTPCTATCCDGLCVDTTANSNHCGACGQACGQAQVCVDGACAATCPTGQTPCTGACVDLQTNAQNCGACGRACAAGQACNDGVCGCASGFEDCDGDPANGCERQGVCACSPGTERSCYSGPPGTENVGVCRAGTQTCNAQGSGWTPCSGDVRPVPEICGNGLDDNCNGQTDEDPDEDGDGYTACGGDCCDSPTAGCAVDASRVNPGAFDFPGNMLDDDCDGTVDNPPVATCSATDILNNTTGQDLARAMELCSTAQNGGFGIVSAELRRADGSGAPDPLQVGVLSSLGNTITPRAGGTLAALSSGTARGVGQPGYRDPGSNYITGSTVDAPARYLAAHGGLLQTAAGCPSGDSEVNDSAMLRLTLKAPTNAEGFSFNFRFLSSEYPTYLCTSFNDFFLVLLDSEHPDVPADGNISFDANGNPVSVNNAFFTTCEARPCGDPVFIGVDADDDGCPDSLACNTTTNRCETSFGACPDGASEILAYTADTGDSGGTSWLTTTAGIIPGETFTLEFHIWDTSDDWLDSIVLIDNFQWRIEPTTVETYN